MSEYPAQGCVQVGEYLVNSSIPVLQQNKKREESFVLIEWKKQQKNDTLKFNQGQERAYIELIGNAILLARGS